MNSLKLLRDKKKSGPLQIAIKDLTERQDRSDRFLFAVVVALLIGFATIFVATAAILVDVWSGKEQALREYSIGLQQTTLQIFELQKMNLNKTNP